MTKEQLDETYESLCANGLSSPVAHFLTVLLERIARLEAIGDERDGGVYIHGRCPECGHRLRQDLPASGCPQCGISFGPYVPYVYPETCECDRCEGVRAGTIEWSDQTRGGEGR